MADKVDNVNEEEVGEVDGADKKADKAADKEAGKEADKEEADKEVQLMRADG